MDIKISEMMQMQRELYKKHQHSWEPMTHEYAKDSLLYMIEEVGECIAILKKKGSQAIMEDPSVRTAFVTEMSDVLMYYHDVLLRLGYSHEDISQAYVKKHFKNMGRDYEEEYQRLLKHEDQ